jgi:hypothetical protein
MSGCDNTGSTSAGAGSMALTIKSLTVIFPAIAPSKFGTLGGGPAIAGKYSCEKPARHARCDAKRYRNQLVGQRGLLTLRCVVHSNPRSIRCVKFQSG